MKAMTGRWIATCRRCRQEVVRAARIGDAELATLQRHLHQLHPGEALSDDAGVEATLKPFAVAPEAAA